MAKVKKQEPQKVLKDRKSTPRRKAVDTQSIKLTAAQGVNLQLMRGLYRYKALRFVIIFAGVSFIWAVIATIMMFTAFATKSEPIILGVDQNNRVMRFQSLAVPLFKNEVIGEKAARVTQKLLTFDYVNYKDILNKLGQKYMSPSGFQAFANEMKKPKGLLDFVVNNKAITKAIILDVPTLSRVLKVSGRDAREFTFNIMIKFKGPDGELTQTYHATAMVVRANRMLYPDGMMLHALKLRLVS